MMARSLVFLLAIASSRFAFAPPLLPECRPGMFQFWLADARAKGREFLRPLELSAVQADALVPGRLLNSKDSLHPGRQNAGVYTLQSAEGPNPVIKFSATSQFLFRADWDNAQVGNRNFQEYLLIHRLFGELGYTPRLEGVVFNPKAHELIDRFAGKNDRGETEYVGIIMEQLNNPWNVSSLESDAHWKQHIPDYVKGWDAATIESLLLRLKEIEGVTNASGISVIDLQVSITQQGGNPPKLHLTDVERFSFDTPGRLDKALFSDEYNRLVDFWEHATGQKLTTQRFQELTGYERVNTIPEEWR